MKLKSTNPTTLLLKCTSYFFFLFLLLSFNGNIVAQTKATQVSLEQLDYYLYLENDSLLQRGDFEEKKGFFSRKYYGANQGKIPLDSIRFFKNENGHFALIHERTLLQKKAHFLVELDRWGAISLYQNETVTTTNYGDGWDSYKIRSKDFFYSKNKGKPKRLSYDHLVEDMTFSEDPALQLDNEVIQSHLAKYKKTKRSQKIQLIAGLGAFVVGGVLFQTEKNKGEVVTDALGQTERKASALAGVGLGVSFAGILTAGFSLFKKPRKHLLNAVDAYNLVY